jgi:hypothetical protein
MFFVPSSKALPRACVVTAHVPVGLALPGDGRTPAALLPKSKVTCELGTALGRFMVSLRNVSSILISTV